MLVHNFCQKSVPFLVCKKLPTNSLLLADCRDLVQHFCYRCLKMWSTDCKRFTSEKTNSTLVSLSRV
ncbi:hypothetical protein Hanom_Chr09g00764211 [Helianthus anomalus]